MNNPVKSLHQNIDQFFDKIQKKFPQEINCRLGCDVCCHTDISVSQIESQLIEEWFHALEDEKKESLKELWSRPQPKGKGYHNEEARPCAFLYEGKCSIYEARPVICRSHGIAVVRTTEETKEIDVCSLNFKNSLPQLEDALDLDRLNTLLAIANKSMNLSADRTRLKKLKDKFLGRNKVK